VERMLLPGARLNAATDVESYFRTMRELVAARSGFRDIAISELGTPTNDLGYLTNFERKARLVDKPVFRLCVERL